MLKKIIIMATLSAALIASGSVAAHATTTPGVGPYAGQQTVNNTAAPGVAVAVASEPTGLAAGTPILIEVNGPTTVTFETVILSTAQTTVGLDGTFRFSVTVPVNAPPGAVYTGTASGEDSDSVFTLAFAVTVAVAAAALDSGAPNSALPNTPSADTGALLWFGAGALVLGVGAVAVFAVKRRATAAATTATTAATTAAAITK
jgi:hypothetical protein